MPDMVVSIPDWSTDSWIGIVGLTVGVLGISASIWIWRKSREETRPCYQRRVLGLISPMNRGLYFSSTDAPLLISFENETSDQVSKLFVAFWNAGRKTLDGKDAALDTDPLTVVLPEGSAIWGNPKVLSTTRQAINFRVEKCSGNPCCAEIKFDFLDRNDGGMFELLCAGSVEGYRITGAFKGSRRTSDRGVLRIVTSTSVRERFLWAFPQVFTGGENAPRLRILSAVLGSFLLLYLLVGNLKGFMIFAFLSLIVMISASVAVTPGGAQRARRHGLPPKLSKVQLCVSSRRSKAGSPVGRLWQDFWAEVDRRRKGQLETWETAQPTRNAT